MMEKNIYRLVNSLLPVTILLLGIHEYLGIATLKVHHFVVAILIVVGLVALVGLRKTGRLVFVISAIICMGLAILIIGVPDMIAFVKSYIGGILGTDTGEMKWGIWHECMQVVLLAVGCFLFQFLAEKFLPVKIAVVVLLLAVSLFDMFTVREMGHIEVVCIWLYAALVYVEWTQRGWEKQKTGKRKQYIVWVMPFLILYFLLMLLIPAKKEPYEWKFATKFFNGLYEKTVSFAQTISGAREDFQMSMTGFTEDGRLLGNLEDNNRKVMEIQGQDSLKTNVYLVGKVYDTFDGTQWLQHYEGTENDRQLDALETMYAIELFHTDSAANYIRLTNLDLYYTYFYTHYMFTPLKTWKIGGKVPSYASNGGNLVFERSEGYGTAYETYFVQINVDNAGFYEFLDSERQDDADIWKELQKKYIDNKEERYSLETLLQHREDIAAVYGQEPELSEEIKTYLDEILEGATTDVEKLKAIEAVLSSYTYTKHPGALPEDIDSPNDFLEYFLFESKEGYCSYFTTAFVLLARAEGIPVRYVEGFCVPIKGAERVTVYSEMAHAWPEAYIEGVGWIPFEPTPGYARIRYTPWETEKPLWTPVEEEEEVTEGPTIPEDSETETEATERKAEESGFWKVLIFVIAFFVTAELLWIAITGAIKRYRYKKWSLQERFLSEVQRNMKILALLGFKRGEAETLSELKNRIMTRVSETGEANNAEEEAGIAENIPSVTVEFLQYYEQILYGNYSATGEMMRVVREERTALMERLKKTGFLIYVYCKLVYRT